jgi:uncharacterized membrane protein YdbT with pleckstrin-like domain
MKKNYYELMEISPEANPDEIKAAMIRLGKIYATKGQTNETARAHFNKIKKAYKILSNPYRRANYNETLKENGKAIAQLTGQLKNWVSYQWQKVRTWQNHQQQVIDQWKEVSEQQAQETWQTAEQRAQEAWLIAEQQAVKSWQLVKQQATTKYISSALIPGETILYQAATHWFFYLDFGAILLVILSSYLLIGNPEFMREELPTISLWVPSLLSKSEIEISVWHIGLVILLWIGLMILWEVFVIKQTTELAITSKRIVAKFGLLNRTMIELKLRRFESITIDQSLLGRILNYGTITITGMGGVKTMVPCLVAPLKFKKVLWQVLEYIVPKDE